METLSVRSRALPRRRPSGILVRQTLLSLLIGSACAFAHAVEAPPYVAMLRQAQANAPRLLAQAASVRAAAADARQSSAWLNPTLSVTAENLGAPQAGGLSQRQDTYSVTQVFEIGGKRSARVEAELRKASAAAARAHETRLTFDIELAVAYATAEAMQQRSQVAGDEVTRAEDDMRAAQALVKAGREAALRVAQARASVAASRAGAQSVSADTTEAFEHLSALAGAAEPFTRIDFPLLAKVAPPPAQASWSLTDAPAVASASAERDALSAQVKVEQTRSIPDIGVTVGTRKFGWSSEKAATVGLSLSIPLFDQNKAGIDAARERANSAALHLESVRMDLVAQHRSALAQVRASQLRLLAAEEGESAASEAYRLGRVGYEAGKTSLLELLAIRRALSEAQALTIESRLAQVRALATLSLAEGRNLFGEAL